MKNGVIGRSRGFPKISIEGHRGMEQNTIFPNARFCPFSLVSNGKC